MVTSNEQSLGLGISAFGQERQSSTLRADTPIAENGPEDGKMDVHLLQATTPTPLVLPQRKTRSSTTSVKAATPTPQVDSLQITTNGAPWSMEVASSTAARNLRKRKGPPVSVLDPVDEALKPLTDEQRQNWKGWVELESDPAIFNYILRKWGVQDIKVQEVFGLDEECLSSIPKPVYGMIFLFRYHDDDAEELDNAEKCPKHVWFANQTTNNACATIALFNIVMNVPGLNLGENLQAFKEATQKLKPAYRGKRLGDDDFIRSIHNSFARKMDILNADLLLKHQCEQWVKDNKTTRKAPAKKKSLAKKNKTDDDDESGYHFIAYVPIQGQVWRLDGLQREPVKLGDCGDNWMAVASANMMQRALQYQDDSVEYSLMSLCKSPLRVAIEEMANNMHSIQALEKILSDIIPDWKVFLDVDKAVTVEDLTSTCKLTQALVDNSIPSESVRAKMDATAAEGNPTMLMDAYRDLAKDQKRLRSAYIQEVGIIGQEDEQASKKKVDNSSMLYKAIQALAEAGVLRDIVDDVREQAARDKK